MFRQSKSDGKKHRHILFLLKHTDKVHGHTIKIIFSMFRQSKFNGKKHTHINFANIKLTRISRTLTNRSLDSVAKNSLQNCCPNFLHAPSFLVASAFPFPLSLPTISALLSFLSCCRSRLVLQRICQEQMISCGGEGGKGRRRQGL
jgi:hypothetical protein